MFGSKKETPTFSQKLELLKQKGEINPTPKKNTNLAMGPDGKTPNTPPILRVNVKKVPEIYKIPQPKFN